MGEDDVSFSWGKKKGRGGAKKEVQFYESFTYDGVKYFLYDSVYIFKEGEQEPYIGKLIKIWEPASKARKVKILWFFHPLEISNYLGNEKVLENELFLASGDGTGLANVNSLEAIAGKCNVVCISKDERNRQPSVEELEEADFVFYRTFDVGSLTISDKLGGKIASIEVEFLLNKKDVELPNQSLNIKVDSQNIVAVVERPLISVKEIAGEGRAIEPGANICSVSLNGVEMTNGLVDKEKGLPKAPGLAGPDDQHPMILPHTDLSVAGQKAKMESPSSMQAVLSEVVKSASDGNRAGPENGICRKSEHGDSLCKGSEKKVNQVEKLMDGSDGVVKTPASSKGEKLMAGPGEMLQNPSSCDVAADKSKSSAKKKFNGSSDVVKIDKSSNGGVALEKGMSKKRKLDTTTHSSESGKKCKEGTPTAAIDIAGNKTVQSAAVSSDCNKPSQTTAVASEISGKQKLAKGSVGMNSGHSGKLKPNGGEESKSNEKLCKPSIKPVKGSQVKGIVGKSDTLSKKLKSDSISVKSDGKLHNGFTKRLKPEDVIEDEANDKLHIESLKPSKNTEVETDGCIKEVARRPLADKEKYYTSIESRMKVAQDQGTLVLLQNLDPSYTSSEVEDIIWSAFGEICSAKMVQCTATSSPHCGQAFAIFKTREAAERIIRRLEQKCLMLPNLRPLVGIPGTLCSPEKQSSFPGHLVLDKLKHQMQRESREAVSTSHSSQSNTIEFELALEWRLLQERSDLSCRKLYKLHEEQLKKLKKRFHSIK